MVVNSSTEHNLNSNFTYDCALPKFMRKLWVREGVCLGNEQEGMLETEFLLTTHECTEWQIWVPCGDQVSRDLWVGTSSSTTTELMTGKTLETRESSMQSKVSGRSLEHFSVVIRMGQIIDVFPFHLHVHNNFSIFQMVLGQAKNIWCREPKLSPAVL